MQKLKEFFNDSPFTPKVFRPPAFGAIFFFGMPPPPPPASNPQARYASGYNLSKLKNFKN